MKIFNLNGTPEWDRTEDREGWRIKDAWVGAHVDAELIGASMYEVEPGNKQGPFHTHHANEEWVVVLRGIGRARTSQPRRRPRTAIVGSPLRPRVGAAGRRRVRRHFGHETLATTPDEDPARRSLTKSAQMPLAQ